MTIVVPIAVVVLQMQLAVIAVYELHDGGLHQGIETGLAEVESAQHRERNRHHDPVDDLRELARRSLQSERKSSVSVGCDRGHSRIELHRSWRQRRRDRLWQALIAALQVVALVGSAEDPEVAGYRLEAEQGDPVQRALR